jgi:hypothetical protein
MVDYRNVHGTTISSRHEFLKGAAAERTRKGPAPPMTQLSPKGLRAVEDVAARTGFSRDAVTSMLASIMAGGGGMAQFSHPEFGGSGQWMAGGAIMISDMFNNALKARVDALCNELSALVRSEPDFVAQDAFLGSREYCGRQSSSLLTTREPAQTNWWPEDLGVPSSLGAQNEVRYAYFPAMRRLALDINGKMTVYDTQDHQINGFSQQQPGSGSFSFSSQLGGVDVSRLPIVSRMERRRRLNHCIRLPRSKRPRLAEPLAGERTYLQL